MGARPQLARTQCAYARMLLDGGSASPAERRRARDLLASVERTARTLGLKRILARTREAREGRGSGIE